MHPFTWLGILLIIKLRKRRLPFPSICQFIVGRLFIALGIPLNIALRARHLTVRFAGLCTWSASSLRYVVRPMHEEVERSSLGLI